MNQSAPETSPVNHNAPRWGSFTRNALYIILALLIFLFALDLMISSLQHLGKTAAETIILATSNPFTGLFIGLLITAIIQSSSATTSMVVALVASGSISMEGAIPIIMGANVGTTITSTIVSLGFITKKKEFVRAVSAGTYHDFFNILTVIVLFPLEYYYGLLSRLAQFFASTFFNEPIGPVKGGFSFLGTGFNPLIHFLVNGINNGFILVIFSFALLFGSILFFRKVISDLLGLGSQERFQRFFFKNAFKSFGWGLLITAVIRSSTVTTSLVVPLVAKRVVKLKAAVPFIQGANIGTTITAFIAAMFNSNAAISIAIAHFLFNFSGVLLFGPIKYLGKIPLKLATGLGKLTRQYRLAGFLYVLVTFFFIPFSLIYLNKEVVRLQELTYEKVKGNDKPTFYSIVTKQYENQQLSSWMVYDELENTQEDPSRIFSVYRRKNLLFINNEMYEFNKPGFCRDGEDAEGVYKLCIREIIPHLNLTPELTLDSIYVFEKSMAVSTDSVSQITYISAIRNIVVKKEIIDRSGRTLESETLTAIRNQE